MKRKSMKILSVLITVCLMVPALSVTAFAEGNPPVLQEAAVIEDGEAVELTFDKDMAQPETGSAGFKVMFSVTDKQVTDAQLDGSDGKKILLTLATAVKGGEDIWLSYTPGTVSATDGGALAAIPSYYFSNALPHPVLDSSPPLDGMLNVPYSHSFTISGGQGPYTFSDAGGLPPGLALDSDTGVLSGTPTATGSYNFGIYVEDSNLAIDSRNFTLLIEEAAGVGNVCQIGSEGYPTLDTALGTIAPGQTATIKLLDNITYNKGIEISGGQSITFDLDGHTLNVVTGSGIGLYVTSGHMGYISPGAFHVTGYLCGVSANGGGASASVSSATATYDGGNGAVALNGGDVVVNGNVQGGYNGAYAGGIGSTIIVNGNATGTSDPVSSAGATAGGGGSVTINGGNAQGLMYGAYANGDGALIIINSGNAVGTGTYSHGVHAEGGGSIQVTGNVQGTQYGVVVSGTYSSAIIGGNVTVTAAVNGWGVDVESSGAVQVGGNVVANGQSLGVFATSSGTATIDGVIQAQPSKYIHIFNTVTEQPVYFDGSLEGRTNPTTKEGYYTYSAGPSTVWVKAVEAVKYATNLQASDPDTTGLGVDGRDFHITWSPSDSNLATGQAIFIVVSGASLDFGNWTPVYQEVFSSGPRTGSWTGNAALRVDSAGEDFEDGDYDVYIVTYSDQTIQTKVTLAANAEAAGSSLDLNWSPASGASGVLSGGISHVTAGNNGELAAINGSGKLIVSGDNGQSWTVCDTGAFAPKDIVYDGNVFITAGNGIMTSPNGTAWTERTVSGSSINWDSYSVNALTTAITSKGVVTIACGNYGLLLASVPSGTDTYSEWVKLYNPNPNAAYVNFGYRFSYVPFHQSGGFNIGEKFVGFGGGSTYTITATQSNPTFLSVSMTSDTTIVNFNNVWYNNWSELFFATTPLGSRSVELRKSVNLFSWTLIDTYDLLNGSTAGGGTTVLVGAGGLILTSEDQVSWISQQVGSSDLNAVIYSGGIFIAVGDSGTILTSEDGWSWHVCDDPGTNADLISVAYSNGEFITGGNNIMLSTASSAPPAFVPVTNIMGVPNEVTAGANLTLNVTVTPANATNKNIVWSVQNAGTTGATVSGNTLSATAAGTVTVRATITNGVSDSLDYTQDFNITVNSTPVMTYTVTFNNNGSVYTTKTINTGESIGSAAWPADPTRSSYTFGGWFTGENGAGTQFTSATAVNASTIVYAKWTYDGRSSGGGGGESKPPNPTYNADVKADDGSATTLPVIFDGNTGRVRVNIDSGSGMISGGKTTVITIPAIPGTENYALGIPVPELSTTGEQGTLTLDTDYGSVTVPSNMLTGILGINGSRAEITIGQGDTDTLPDDVKAVIGDKPLIQLTLSIDGNQIDWNNPDVPITVSIPYTPTAEELLNPESLVIWYIDGSGMAVSVQNGHYDPDTGTVTFTTTHFSDYAVAYVHKTFSDVMEKAWYKKAVDFVSARDITTGTGGGKFSPDANLTRSQFIVMLMRAYDVAPDSSSQDNFSDAGNTYYTGYLAAAKRLGITEGVGDNQFAPSREISRQEMFTLLYHTLTAINKLPQSDSGKVLSDFSDGGQIASWATEAMMRMVKTGVINGSVGKLLPAGMTTRAEMTQVLYNLVFE